MKLFLFPVSLEFRRGLVPGELRSRRMAALSISAALGGMFVPALLYLMMQSAEPGQHGWGTAMATDTAFVIGSTAPNWISSWLPPFRLWRESRC